MRSLEQMQSLRQVYDWAKDRKPVTRFLEERRQTRHEYQRLIRTPHLFAAQYVPPDSDRLNLVRGFKAYAFQNANGYELEFEGGSLSQFQIENTVVQALTEEQMKKGYTVTIYEPLQLRATGYKLKGNQIEKPRTFASIRLWRDLTEDEVTEAFFGTSYFENGWVRAQNDTASKVARVSNQSLNNLGINVDILPEFEFPLQEDPLLVPNTASSGR